MECKRIAVDTSKSVFTLHGVDAEGHVVLRGDRSRSGFLALMAKQPPTEVVLEACGGSHHWGRQLQAMGHRVRLIPPQAARPFAGRQKNDRNDARALCIAAEQVDIPEVPVRSAAHQAEAMILKVRELLVRQRTQLINALRGHAAEFGVVAAKGTQQVGPLMARLEADAALPEAALEMLRLLARQVAQLDEQIAELNQRLQQRAKSDPVARRLAQMPGIGPIGAAAFSLVVDPGQFASGRHFAAWLGLTPKQHSTGGKPQLGAITRAGNETLRSLLVVGAMAVIRHAAKGGKGTSPWLLQLLERKPRKLAAVALANKMARSLWAMMARGEDWRPPGGMPSAAAA